MHPPPLPGRSGRLSSCSDSTAGDLAAPPYLPASCQPLILCVWCRRDTSYEAVSVMRCGGGEAAVIDYLTWMCGETGLRRGRKKGRGWMKKQKTKQKQKTAAGNRIVAPTTLDDVISLIWHRCFTASLVGEKMKRKQGRLALINVGVHSACTCILTLLEARQDGEFSQWARICVWTQGRRRFFVIESVAATKI